MQIKNKPLVVYKASAGSGKTFTLATEYIKHVITNPQSYRNILAVTFTNKATEEMKMRILSQLYGIWKQLSDSKDYTDSIMAKTGLSAKAVSDRAGIALHLLLHNYSYFRVTTIDTFFQSVLRNLARELELTANLRVELNDSQVEDMAVDELIQDLQATDKILQWILKYIMDNINEDRSWNVISSIKSFGLTIFKDFYKKNRESLNEQMSKKGFFEAFTKRLQEQAEFAEKRLRQIGSEGLQAFSDEGISAEDIKNGKNILSFYTKLKNGIFDESIVNKTVEKYSTDTEAWLKKGADTRLLPVIDNRLRPMLYNAIDERRLQWHRYKSASLTLRHLNQIRLLSSIEQKVKELNRSANRFLLSDTQHLLHALINDNDSPFIFEKIGSQLEHIMIDEFQDTSTVQWKNFKVLLEECMSHEGADNLIVGDVKQSIYRWRSGDWRLLNNIQQEFEHPEQMLKAETLSVNFRSKRNIITFNNTFFRLAAQQEYNNAYKKVGEAAQQILDAYADVHQECPDDLPATGLASITLLPATDYEQQSMVQLEKIIRRLLDNKVTQNRIAILLRSKKNIPAIINYMSQQMPEVNFVSDEAFRLDASFAVRMMVQAMYLLVHPEDQLMKAVVAKGYQSGIKQEPTEEQWIHGDVDMDGLLPEGFLSEREQLLRLPLMELAERLYVLFQLEQYDEQGAYVCAFYDYMNSYINDNSTDIESFVNYWDDTLCQKTIQSDSTDGIRIITIHKSKGLEFDNIIIPFCDWKLEMPETIWCNADESPYNELSIVPVDYSSKLMGTTYEAAYKEEYLQKVVDNLNMLYVAFTRARSNLFVIGKRATERAKLIQDILPAVQQELTEAILTEDMTFEYGTLDTSLKQKRKSDNVFLQPSTAHEVHIRTFTNKTNFRQSNKSRDFIEGETADDSTTYIQMGNVLHNVFSQINTPDDIDRVLQQMQAEGVLYDANLSYERVRKMLHKRLEDSRVADWFSGRWKLFNECSILSIDEENDEVVSRRPDRVMTDGKQIIVVDFKFGRPNEDYREQVDTYKSLLYRMGYKDVRGYLWYVYNNQIEEV